MSKYLRIFFINLFRETIGSVHFIFIDWDSVKSTCDFGLLEFSLAFRGVIGAIGGD